MAHGRLLAWGFLGIAVATIVAVLLYIGVSKNGVIETTLQPRAVLQDPGVDPRVLEVGVAWTKEGWCLGEFRVKARETDSLVTVDAVIDREDPNGNCAGVGAASNMAWAEFQLATPLGTRPVVGRAGMSLPYYTSGDGLVRKGPSSADISHYGGLNDQPQFRLRKTVTVKDPVVLAQLVGEIDAMPPFPAGTMYCALDDGSYYLFVIRYLNGGSTTIKAAGGCQALYLIPPNRAVAWAAKSPGFYPLVAGLLGE